MNAYARTDIVFRSERHGAVCCFRFVSRPTGSNNNAFSASKIEMQAWWDRRPACPEMTGKMRLSQNSDLDSPCYLIAMLLVPRLCLGMRTGRLRLHFMGEMTGFSGRSPEGMGSQAEPGNQNTEAVVL